MVLRDKIEKALNIFSVNKIPKLIEGIADEHAISFWEWRSTTSIKNIDQYTNEETLKMFKEGKKL
jgi:hypothetical protein